MARCDVMINAMKVIKAIEGQRGDFTMADIRRATGLHRRSVYRYFTAACFVMPIVEVCPCRDDCGNGGGRAAIYRLMRTI